MKTRLVAVLLSLLVLLFALPLSAKNAAYSVDLHTIMTPRCLDHYTKTYRPKKQHKAFAYARNREGRERCGWSYGKKSSSVAKQRALHYCAKKDIGAACKIIDVNGVVAIQPGDFTALVPPDAPPTPAEADALIDKAADMLEGRCIGLFRKYMRVGGHKAFAYTVREDGLYAYCAYASRYVPDVAEGKALAKCNARRDRGYKRFAPPCKLFAQGSVLLVTPEDYGLTVKPLTLHLAAERKSLRTVKALVEGGADVNATNRFGGSPLTEAAWAGRLDVVAYLLAKGADMHHRENMGFDALNIAAERGNTELFKFLVRKGGNIHTQTNKPGDMPIHFAAKRGAVEIVKLLIELGVDVNVRNKFTETPLHAAADQGRLEMVKLLVAHRADVNAQTRRGITPLDEAVYRKRKEVVQYLIAQGGKTNNPEHH